MKMRYYWIFLFLSIGLYCVSLAEPHALNPESIDRYAEITLTPGRLVVIYEILLGIAPTARAASQLDANHDNVISDEERSGFVSKNAEMFGQKQIVQIGDSTLPLRFVQGDVYRTIGHNGINILKIDAGYVCDLPAGIPRETTLAFQYKDTYLENLPGWKQIHFSPRDGVRYSGHIPYGEFKKFDYEIIVTKGFIPASDFIDLEVWLPSSANSSPEPAVVLPEKDEVDLSVQALEISLLYKIWIILGGIGAVIAVVCLWIRRRSNSRPQ